MEEEDAGADPYLPYDGGGDTIPLQEIPKKRGTPRPLMCYFFGPLFPPFLTLLRCEAALLLVQ